MQQCNVVANQLTETDFTGTNFSHFNLSSAELQHLTLQGVCTRETNTLNLRYKQYLLSFFVKKKVWPAIYMYDMHVYYVLRYREIERYVPVLCFNMYR